MYFVDKKQIEDILLYIDKLLEETNNHALNTFMEKLYLERTVHILIESILDVGNMLIDGFIMRDPGGFEDIINILIDEEVLPPNEKDTYKVLIRLRKMVVKEYLTVDHQQLMNTLDETRGSLDQFSSHIRQYLDNELETVNAFYN